MLWTIRNQRRNLSDIDRISLAAKSEEIVARKAKDSYVENVGRPLKSSAKLPAISKSQHPYPGRSLRPEWTQPPQNPSAKLPEGLSTRAMKPL